MRLACAVLVVGAMALTGCASSDSKRVAAAATTPLSDLNLVSAPIPDVLKAAEQGPYKVPADSSCPALLREVKELDAVLGADLDTPPTASNPGLVERGGSAVAGATQKAVEGAIPFRGWIRKLSGAERYSGQVAAAIAAGTVRRAFLKGIAHARSC